VRDSTLFLVRQETLGDALAKGAIIITPFRSLGDALGIVGALQFVIPRRPIEFSIDGGA
jgi:hypothetical protein